MRASVAAIEPQPCSRLSRQQKLRALDPTSSLRNTAQRLKGFADLFAYRRCDAIKTLAGKGPKAWYTFPDPLTTDLIARHLLGDRIPGYGPVWVGARCFAQSRFFCIDVDADKPTAGDRRPFAVRRLELEAVLRYLGIDPADERQVLIQETPSGGRHYYVFFSRLNYLSDYKRLLTEAGLRFSPGEMEFFPSQEHGIRLPFGCLPGRSSDPKAWIRFIDDFFKKARKLFDLNELLEHLYMVQGEGQFFVSTIPNRPSDQAASKAPKGRSGKLGMSRKSDSHTAVEVSHAAKAYLPHTEVQQRYLDLVGEGLKSFGDAKELLDLGVLVQGTRTAALKRLAMHLIWHRGLTAEVAAEQLITWAYNARHVSEDIAHDLETGRRAVSKQIVRLCRWCARHGSGESRTPDRNPHAWRVRFSESELRPIELALSGLALADRATQADFYLSFLTFAKLHGTAAEDQSGWDAAPAINAVVRKWPGCHHMHYKTRVQRAEEAKLLTVVRGHWQNPRGKGRARTYRLAIPIVPAEQCHLDHNQARSFLVPPARVDATGEVVHIDVPTSPITHPSEPANHGQVLSFRPRDESPPLRTAGPRSDLDAHPRERFTESNETSGLRGTNPGTSSPGRTPVSPSRATCGGPDRGSNWGDREPGFLAYQRPLPVTRCVVSNSHPLAPSALNCATQIGAELQQVFVDSDRRDRAAWRQTSSRSLAAASTDHLSSPVDRSGCNCPVAARDLGSHILNASPEWSAIPGQAHTQVEHCVSLPRPPPAVYSTWSDRHRYPLSLQSVSLSESIAVHFSHSTRDWRAP